MTNRGTVLIANPSADVYGSDLQMLEAASALIASRWRVVVATPDDGPLITLLRERGVEVIRVSYPVLRRENASLKGIVRLLRTITLAFPAILRTIRQAQPSVVLVNTVTLPWWLLASRLAHVRTACYVHEAELNDNRLVRTALNAPLLLAHKFIAISPSVLDAVSEALPFIARRGQLIYNGVPAPDENPAPIRAKSELRKLIVVGRLSPRKGTDVAMDAVGLLRKRGRDVVLNICGTPFAGYEWFADHLIERAAHPDLQGAVTFSGYINPVWPVLADSDIVLAPSLREPFGNAVVEAQLASRPVIAAAAMGHLLTVQDRRTGLLVPPGDPAALASAVETLIDNPDLANEIAESGRLSATSRFSLDRYVREISDFFISVAPPKP